MAAEKTEVEKGAQYKHVHDDGRECSFFPADMAWRYYRDGRIKVCDERRRKHPAFEDVRKWLIGHLTLLRIEVDDMAREGGMEVESKEGAVIHTEQPSDQGIETKEEGTDEQEG